MKLRSRSCLADRYRNRKPIQRAFWCLILFVGIGVVHAEPATESEPLATETEITQVERNIAVQQPNSDQAIQARLQRILTSSNKYSDLTVDVDEGLVRLKGNAKSVRAVDWATDIATNIDDVIGVINDIEAQTINLLSFEPIQRAAMDLWRAGLKTLPLIILGLVVVSAFFAIARPLASVLVRPLTFAIESTLLIIVIRRLITFFICMLGLYFFLQIAGLTHIAVALVSGTGVIGLVLGFAFRDIAENFMSSLLLSAQRPFSLGDVIQINDALGVVFKVTTRGTTLLDFDGNHIQIPNSVVYKSTIRNMTANPKIRGTFVLGIGYDTSIDTAQRLALELLDNHHAVLADPEPQVLVETLGSATLNLRFYYWVDGSQLAANKVSSSVMKQIVQLFLERGISMPDDAREVIFPQGVQIEFDPMQAKQSYQTQQQGNQQQTPSSNNKTQDLRMDDDKPLDERPLTENLGSDRQAIEQQAKQAKAPEAGANIL